MQGERCEPCIFLSLYSVQYYQIHCLSISLNGFSIRPLHQPYSRLIIGCYGMVTLKASFFPKRSCFYTAQCLLNGVFKLTDGVGFAKESLGQFGMIA